MMKKPLFINHSMAKASFVFLLLIYIGGMPVSANAGFFSNIFTRPVIAEAPLEESIAMDPNKETHNSQTIPLLESSINPDQINIKDALPTTIIEDETLVSNVGPLGPTLDLGKYASSAKISTYIVKNGDTLEGITKKLNISKSTILSSNADLKSADLLKVGQVLTILPIEGISYKIKKGDTLEGIAKKYTAESNDIAQYNAIDKSTSLKVGDSIIIPGGKLVKEEEKTEKVIVKKEEPKPIVPEIPINGTNIQNTQIEAPTQVVVQTPVVDIKTEITLPTNLPADTGQPEGTISGGYIWPFPAGVGRVSQELHADQGYDFAAPKGTPILAIQSGTVLIADASGYNGGYGLYVVINFDDGGQAILGHMSKVAAEPGQVVKRGDVIGYVGSTGKSTGNHVHIGYRGGKPSPYSDLKKNSTSINDHD